MPTNLDEASFEAAQIGNTNVVVHLLDAGSDPKANTSSLLRIAAENGHLEVVKLLLPVSAPTTCGSWALRLAAEYGYLEVVKPLLPVSNPKDVDSAALSRAAQNGYLEIVRLLLQHSSRAKALRAIAITAPQDCDLPLPCLQPPDAKKFMAANPDTDLPRTRAMLVADKLKWRQTGQAMLGRQRRRA